MSELCRSTRDPRWMVVEEGFDLVREHEIESLFSVSNGNTGTRGSLEEECPLSAPATFVAGVFLHSELPGVTPELLKFPNWISTRIWVGGSPLMMREGEILEHRRVLDLGQGVLWREWRQKDSHGRITRFNSLRLASLADRRLLLQRVVLTAENYCLDIGIESSYELGLGIRALSPQKKGVIESDREAPIPLVLVLPDGTVEVAFCINSQLLAPGATHQQRELKKQEDRVVESFRIQAGVGTYCELSRFVSIIRQRDSEDVLAEALNHASAALSSGVESAICAHHARWQSKWNSADVQIGGDDRLQQAVRFGAYHLISAANPDDSRTSVGARALTGTGYRGHVFWDTEIYMLPFYTCTAPASARALLGYRYHTLPAARDKARGFGYRGAMWAWESADTGDEVAPATSILPSGEVIRIRNDEMEVHITADIGYAVWQYWKGTADDVFLLDYGAEILLESARFWASRGTIEPDGLYHIRHVIGPDEYHDDVDDNAFTNLMAEWVLRRGTEIAELLRERWGERGKRLFEKLQLSESETSNWPKLADVMATRFDPATLVYEQFAGYYDKEHVDLKSYEPRFAAMDAILGYERIRQTNIVKQPDVVMAIYLLWDQFPPEVREANFRFYEPKTAHGSSLSPSIHALLAARLGDIELAGHYLKRSAEIDLGNTLGNAAAGVHTAAIGGLWQAIVFGFAGVQLYQDDITISPNLLANWGRLSFPLQCRNCRLQITIEPQSVRVESAGPGAIKIRMQDGKEFIAKPQHSYVSSRGASAWNGWQTDVKERSCA